MPLAAFDEYLAPTGRQLDGGIGYLELPGVSSGPKAANYDDTLNELLDQIDDGTLRGCIIDLRRNTGGTLWPMLAGIGPPAGAGKVGAFVSAHGGADWSYDAELGLRRLGERPPTAGDRVLAASRPLPQSLARRAAIDRRSQRRTWPTPTRSTSAIRLLPSPRWLRSR